MTQIQAIFIILKPLYNYGSVKYRCVMSDCINCQNQPIPCYSGITINITNPVMNATCPQNYRAQVVNPGARTVPVGSNYIQNQTYTTNPIAGVSPNGYYSQAEVRQLYDNNRILESENDYTQKNVDSADKINNTQKEVYVPKGVNIVSPEEQSANENVATGVNIVPPEEQSANENVATGVNIIPQDKQSANEEVVKSVDNSSQPVYTPEKQNILNDNASQAAYSQEGMNDKQEVTYPPETATDKLQETYNPKALNDRPQTVNAPEKQEKINVNPTDNYTKEDINSDLSISKEIIEDLDAKNAEQKAAKANVKETKVVALTNEYIMSLENYLNNPNTDIRLMASKEILTRLDEDRDRYDDAALNALLNKMLQDPSKLIRVAALSALSSGLASGNNYTVKLLNDIQNNPDSDKQDVLDAAQILLNRTAKTEVKYVHQNNEKAGI